MCRGQGMGIVEQGCAGDGVLYGRVVDDLVDSMRAMTSSMQMAVLGVGVMGGHLEVCNRTRTRMVLWRRRGLKWHVWRRCSVAARIGRRRALLLFNEYAGQRAREDVWIVGRINSCGLASAGRHCIGLWRERLSCRPQIFVVSSAAGVHRGGRDSRDGRDGRAGDVGHIHIVGGIRSVCCSRSHGCSLRYKSIGKRCGDG